MADYIPNKRELRKAWLENLSTKAAAQVVSGGGTAATATSLKTAADDIIAAYDATDAAKTTYEGKRAVEADTDATELANIRRLLTTLKVLPNWRSSGADAELQASSSVSEFDANTYKPEFAVSIKGGLITLDFKKRGADGLAIYGRLRGTQGWVKLGVDTSSPYIDGRPLAVAGVPETREYLARGIIDDEEIGIASDIVSVTFAG
jgi:hypothetical protein